MLSLCCPNVVLMLSVTLAPKEDRSGAGWDRGKASMGMAREWTAKQSGGSLWFISHYTKQLLVSAPVAQDRDSRQEWGHCLSLPPLSLGGILSRNGWVWLSLRQSTVSPAFWKWPRMSHFRFLTLPLPMSRRFQKGWWCPVLWEHKWCSVLPCHFVE